ncbi:serine protease [Pelomonas sp. HMWF004]|nr:serine protease [Pelomonas sp. HMWF004]
MSRPLRMPWLGASGAALLVLLALCGCASPPPRAEQPPVADMQVEPGRFIVVAVANPLQRLPSRAGTSLSSYGATPRYTQGEQAAQTLAAIAQRHNLREAAAWPIPTLGVQCVVFEIAPGASREQVLAELARDEQVQLAQPLQEFELRSSEPGTPPYNDPYLPMQQGYLAMGVPQAHRLSTGRGTHIAVIDTGAQIDHPDLRGRAITQANMLDDGRSATPAERHGTEVVGLIAATANNAQGIAGIAPDARISLYRACWYGTTGGLARCNSFTLAKALAQVLASDAAVINLSLGGPEDALLGQLLGQLLRQGRTVVAALPPDGQRSGFPAGVPGVIAVAESEQVLPAGAAAVRAPGRDVLTLQPGGRYDFASGSSMAAAQVSGMVALLMSAEPRLDRTGIEALLRGREPGAGADGSQQVDRMLDLALHLPPRLARR